MEEENKKEKRKISLVTYVLSLIAMALIATLFIVLSLNNKENKNVKELNNTVQPNTTTIEQTEITPEVTKEITPEVTTNTTNEKTEENFNGDYTNKIDENAGGSLSIKNYNADEFEFQLSLYRGTNAPKTANLEGKAKKISDNKYVYEEEKDEYAYKLNFELLKNNDNIVIELKEEGYDKNSKKEFETHPENVTGLSYDGKYKIEETKNENADYIEMTEEIYKKYNNEGYSYILKEIVDNSDGTVTLKSRVYKKEQLPVITSEQYQNLLDGKIVRLYDMNFKKTDHENTNENSIVIAGKKDNSGDSEADFIVNRNTDGTFSLEYEGEPREATGYYTRTNIIMQITLDRNTEVEWGGGPNKILDYYKDKEFKEETDEKYTFIYEATPEFIFENGKCIKLKTNAI